MIWVQYTLFGLGVGAMFSLLAAGIVLVYRASGVLNFAHASMAMICAYVNFDLLERIDGMPVGVALLLAMVVGAALGVLSHRFVFAPVAAASQVVRLIVSFGLAGVLQGAAGLIWNEPGHPNPFHKSLFPLDEGLHVAGVLVSYQRLALIGFGTFASLGLAVLLRSTSFGIQVRALAQNPLAARLAGIDETRVQTVTWALAGATAALAGVLLIPFGALNPLSLSGFQLKALAAALVGGFVSLPAALVGGLGLGVAQELLVGAPAPLNGMRTALSAVLVLVLLIVGIERFFVSAQEQRALEGDAQFLSGAGSPVVGSPTAWLTASMVVAVAVLALSGFWSFVATRTLVYALLGLSLVTLTGWSGQVSLMPGTFAGVGACLAWVFGTRLGYPLPVVLPLAALATVPVCAMVGLAALRLRPLYLAVGTVALAGLFEETLFRQHWFANGGDAMRVTRPVLLRGDHAFGIAVVLTAGVLFAATAAFGRGRTGRALRMVSDNAGAAAAGGVNPMKYRLLAFVVSSAYAGLAGAVLAYLLGAYSTAAFGFLVLSLATFGLATVGGIRSPLGAMVGAFLFVYLTEVFRSSASVSDWTTVAVGAGIIVVMARSPDGLVGLGGALRSLRVAGAVDA